jgi:hypothetical protein
MNYLFGKPVGRTRPSADGPREFFVLGAYPSALHVRWHVPGQVRPVQAVAVDDEPEPFWTGHDEQLQITRWLGHVAFVPSWGRVGPCGRLNGSSGAWVDGRVLQPLGADRGTAWITDCLDTYFESTGAAARLGDPAMAATMHGLGIAAPRHRHHPSENDIVREALEHHRERLMTEIRTAKPRVLVSLGNAALRVVAGLSDAAGHPRKLSPNRDLYGRRLRGRIAGQSFDWIPLGHPASPPAYQQAHAAWAASEAAARPNVAGRA